MGLEGNDILEGKAGADLLDGGPGVDTVTYINSPAAVTIDLATGTGRGGDAEGDVISNIENVVGSNYDDTIIGTTGNNRLEGGEGNDLIENGGGTDVLIGGAGIDTFKITNSSGNIEILDFTIGEDKLDLSQVDVHSFSELQITMTQGNTQIALPGNIKIILDNVNSGDLRDDCFIFSSSTGGPGTSSNANDFLNWVKSSEGIGVISGVGGLILAGIGTAYTIRDCKDKGWFCFKKPPSVVDIQMGNV